MHFGQAKCSTQNYSAFNLPLVAFSLSGDPAKSDNGGGVVKQTSQRSLLFRQNVNRTEAENGF